MRELGADPRGPLGRARPRSLPSAPTRSNGVSCPTSRPVSRLASFCLTEPGGGSDLPGLKTTATRTPDGWRISGHKRFISNAGYATWYAVLARTGERGYGVFMVHRDDPGFSVGAQERKMGVRGAPLADLMFDDVMVPEDRVVGDPAKGYDYMMDGLTYTRPLIAAHALGIAQGALDAAVTYTGERTPVRPRRSRGSRSSAAWSRT